MRRPLRGLEVKDDTYALIRMIKANGAEIPLLDSGSYSGETRAYANFILQNVQEARMEKHQIVETFGEPYIFFFGEAPRFLDIQAVLVNSHDFNWEAEWWFNYENYFRGTKSVEHGARTYLFYEDNVVEGYILQAQSVKVSEQPMVVQLVFRLFVTNYDNISFIGEPSFPIRSGASIPDGIDLTDDLNSEQINALVAGSTSGSVIDGQFVANAPLDRNFPIRSNIVDNWDEWTADPPIAQIDPFADPALISEVESLQQAVLSTLNDFGVEQGGPGLLSGLGLQPTFSSGPGIGFGAGASSGVSATFGASASAGVHASTGATAGAGYGGGVGAGATTYVGGSSSAFALVSADGDLDATGQANASASASVGI